MLNSDELASFASKGLHRVLREEVEKIAEAEIVEAKKRVEDKVRGMLGQIATRIFSTVAFERFGNDIRITVNIPVEPRKDIPPIPTAPGWGKVA